MKSKPQPRREFMRLPELVAPLHLRGDMRGKPGELRAERAAWAAAAGLRGYTTIDVGAALGLSPHAARCAMISAGWGGGDYRRDARSSSRNLNQQGILVGYVGVPFDALPVEDREAAIAIAAKTGKSIAEVLVDCWKAHRTDAEK